MNGQYGKSEAILMDKEILQRAVEEQAGENLAGCIAKAEGIHFNQVYNLRLGYRNILEIDCLWEFTSLARLHLNNNRIEKIVGLEGLINLTWLDLSFNRINKIEGLQSLLKLEVLNLNNNKISVIENMDTLQKLTHFCIANNHIGQLDNVLYLRTFKNLFTLNLFGNPVSKEDNYKFFIAAHFPDLICLDYRVLKEKTKNEAALKYQYVLEEMRREQLQIQQADNAEQSQKAELQLQTDAFVESLNGSYLFKSMFEDDPEAETLQCVPGVDHLLQTFEHHMVDLCTQLFEVGLAEHKQREAEVNAFLSAHAEAVAVHQKKASQILANFEHQHTEKMEEMQQLSDPDVLKVKMNHCNDEINKLCKSFMSLEFQLVRQLEDIIKKLDINISEMVGNFSETVQGIFAQCRDLEDNYNQDIKKIAVATLEQVAKDNLENNMSANVRMLFTDKDTVMDALATGHDNHLVKINDRETLLLTRVNAWKVTLMKGIQDKELKRNRMRLSDIYRYMDHLREHLEELQ
ncbi:dynein regulatory complex subunit 3 [Mastacembelus armatus]|uniref:dynein regulatory complex subunit 3 n=1 Tax=Mastacembelus armatus TaxID=205130 RepID=UPI000E45B081|nr:dynein regulatory complex subunit 3 [Mastacembelus armatus]